MHLKKLSKEKKNKLSKCFIRINRFKLERINYRKENFTKKSK